MITDQQIEAAELQRKQIEASERQSKIIADNRTAAVREKLQWLDERDRLDRLARELRLT